MLPKASFSGKLPIADRTLFLFFVLLEMSLRILVCFVFATIIQPTPAPPFPSRTPGQGEAAFQSPLAGCLKIGALLYDATFSS